MTVCLSALSRPLRSRGLGRPAVEGFRGLDAIFTIGWGFLFHCRRLRSYPIVACREFE